MARSGVGIVSKEAAKWFSHRVGQEVQLVRWGESGTPVLVFPTAGGDAEEGERFHLIDSISDSLEECRAKAYSVDSIAGQAWTERGATFESASAMQNRFDEMVIEEIVPAIRNDCGDTDGSMEIVVAGASIGAFNALAAICRHPDVFSKAICLSGTYDLRKFLSGPMNADYHRASPLHFVPDLPDESEHLALLRSRFVLLAHGKGRYESPEESWRVANCLGARDIPNRVDEWGEEWHHDWVTWRDMLPKYLGELLD